jgi:hypothetical protein
MDTLLDEVGPLWMGKNPFIVLQQQLRFRVTALGGLLSHAP